MKKQMKNKGERIGAGGRLETLVDVNQIKRAVPPEILTSGELGPYIGIAIYDYVTGISYMMNMPNFKSGKIDLDHKINEIKQTYLTPERLGAVATGNSALFSYPDIRERQKEDRRYVENILKKHFKESHIRIEWMPNNYTAELVMDTSEKEPRIIKRDLEGREHPLHERKYNFKKLKNLLKQIIL